MGQDRGENISERQARRVIVLLSSVIFISVMTGTMINVALPFIGRHFHVTEATYSWIVTGYVLTFGIFNAVHGRLADVYGTRRLYVMGLIVFGGTAIAVAASPSIGLAIALRLIQGAGAAALPALGTTIISKVIPPHRRGAAMGMVVGVVGVAASIGPFIGGLVLEAFGWRAVFLFSSINLLAIPFVFKLLPPSLDKTIPQRFDIVGAALLSFGTAALMLSFNILKSYGFGIQLAVTLVAAMGLFALFITWIRRSETPFVEPSLFSDTRFVAGMVVAALTNATRFGTVVLVPILMVEVEGTSAIVVGAVLFPGALCIAFVSPRAGRWADQVGARRPALVGTIWVLLGILVTAFSSGCAVWGVAVGMTLYGLGFAFVQSPLLGANSRILPSAQMGVGMGIFMMIFFLGGAFGIAFTVALVELQGATATSWIGLDLGGGARFSNAIFCLVGLNLIAFTMVNKISGPLPKPKTESPEPIPETIV